MSSKHTNSLSSLFSYYILDKNNNNKKKAPRYMLKTLPSQNRSFSTPRRNTPCNHLTPHGCLSEAELPALKTRGEAEVSVGKQPPNNPRAAVPEGRGAGHSTCRAGTHGSAARRRTSSHVPRRPRLALPAARSTARPRRAPGRAATEAFPGGRGSPSREEALKREPRR